MKTRLAAVIASPSSTKIDRALPDDIRRVLGVINAMTPEERSNSDLLLDSTRRERIAKDAEVSVADVNEVVAQREALANMLAKMEAESQQ